MTGRLDRLLRPTSLAFVGGEPAGLAIDQCRALGFDGEMWAVHPTRPAVRDIATVPTVADLPAAPDAAFVGVNRAATVEVVRQLAEMGAGAAVCHASGFAEVDEAGAALESHLVLAGGDMPIIGPNCYGTLSGITGAALWPDQQGLHRCDRGVAFVMQSGNIALNVTMQQRGLDVAHVLTLGNQADVTVEEALDALVADETVSGVGLYVEALHDVGRFVAAVDRAHDRGVPVVAIKTGATAESRRIAASHTSSIVGADAGYEALFERIGVHRVHTIPQLLDTLHVLTTVGSLPGNRLVSLSCSGGEAALVADRAPHLGVALPPFPDDRRERVGATFHEYVSVSNPLDYHTFIWNDAEGLTACFTEALTGPFDAAMLVLDFPRPGLDDSSWWLTLDAFTRAVTATGTPGIVAATMAENLPGEVRRRARACGVAAVAGIDAALHALAQSARSPAAGYIRLLPCDPPAGSSASLTEHEAKEILGRAGITVPRHELTAPADAVEVADRIGYPVAVKVSGAAHKTEIDGVAVGLLTATDVDEATARLGRLADELLVEAFIDDAIAELLVSVRNEWPVGWLLTLGAGGIETEMYDDTVNLLLPATADAITAALHTLAIWPRLEGHRSRPAAAVDAIIEVVHHLTELVAQSTSLLEIEINPLIVTADQAVAVDALVTDGDGS